MIGDRCRVAENRASQRFPIAVANTVSILPQRKSTLKPSFSTKALAISAIFLGKTSTGKVVTDSVCGSSKEACKAFCFSGLTSFSLKGVSSFMVGGLTFGREEGTIDPINAPKSTDNE